MKEIPVKEKGSVLSKVYVEESFSCLPSCLPDGSHAFLLYDRNVSDVADIVRDAVAPVSEMAADVSESSKTLETVACISRWLMESGADRDAVLVAVGGGILTDVAGFTAAVYKRGIRTVYVPTTLLAQVDASVGGKTGVNLDGYKNMLGVVRQPAATYICPLPLFTLPEKEFLAGVAEMLKTFIIGGPDSYLRTVSYVSSARLQKDMVAALRSRTADLMDLVCKAVSIKAAIVSEDQFESGGRRKLNLGHTFAHAIEWYDRTVLGHGPDGCISHGEAVSVGLACAARLSENTGLCCSGFADRIVSDLLSCGLPVTYPATSESLAPAMSRDKKAENGKVRFILIRDLGDVVEKMYSPEEISPLWHC